MIQKDNQDHYLSPRPAKEDLLKRKRTEMLSRPGFENVF